MFHAAMAGSTETAQTPMSMRASNIQGSGQSLGLDGDGDRPVPPDLFNTLPERGLSSHVLWEMRCVPERQLLTQVPNERCGRGAIVSALWNALDLEEGGEEVFPPGRSGREQAQTRRQCWAGGHRRLRL